MLLRKTYYRSVTSLNETRISDAFCHRKMSEQINSKTATVLRDFK